MTAWGELMYCIRQSVRVCVFRGWRAVGGGFIILTWKVVCLETWHISDKLHLHCPPSVFYITLLVARSKICLFAFVQICSIAHGAWILHWRWKTVEVKMKNHQVLTSHMAALDSLLFDGTPLQLKLWIMMFLSPFDLGPTYATRPTFNMLHFPYLLSPGRPYSYGVIRAKEGKSCQCHTELCMTGNHVEKSIHPSGGFDTIAHVWSYMSLS